MMRDRIHKTSLDRVLSGALFGEDVVLIRHGAVIRNKHGEATQAKTETAIRAATEPLSRTDSRVAALIDGGIRLQDAREFFTFESIDVAAQEQVRYPAVGGETFTAHSTARYPRFSATIFVRDEVQPGG